MVEAKVLPGGIVAQTLTVEQAKNVLYRAGIDISREHIQQGLRDGPFPFGFAVRMTEYKYFIFRKKLADYIRDMTGLEVDI